MPWSRKRQPTTVFLPGMPWTEEPGRLRSAESWTRLSTHTHTHTHTGAVDPRVRLHLRKHRDQGRMEMTPLKMSSLTRDRNAVLSAHRGRPPCPGSALFAVVCSFVPFAKEGVGISRAITSDSGRERKKKKTWLPPGGARLQP